MALTERHHPIGKSGLVEYGGGLTMVVMDPGDTLAGIEGSHASLHWLKGAGVDIGAYIYLPLDHLLIPGTDLDRFLLSSEVDTGSIDVLCEIQSTPSTGTSDAWTGIDSDTQTVGSGQRYDTFFAFQSAPVHGCLNAGGHKRYRARMEVTAKTGTPATWAVYGMGCVWYAATAAALVGDSTA